MNEDAAPHKYIHDHLSEKIHYWLFLSQSTCQAKRKTLLYNFMSGYTLW